MRVVRLVSKPIAAALLLLASPVSADSAWTVPGIVNASGLNGTHFVSDLTLTNPGSAPANVTLSFFPSGSGAKTLALAPGQTIVSSDVVASLFASPGAAGALSIGSDQPLLIRAKTYNTGASGTYGVALPVVASDRLLAPGDVGDSLWISQDASGGAGFRTNVAVVFPDASGGAATVTVYDADGNARGSQTFSLNAPGLQQFSVGSFAGAVSVGRARIAVMRGHVAGYAVVVDNVTGDSSLFAFEDLPAGIQNVLVNGVARANGRNGAFFRTDGRFYNPTDTDATMTVAFHANANANPSPATASFVVPAGKIRDVVDVLDSLLALPVGSAGALRFQSEWPVAILCRTSNVDPTGSRPGTFGAQQRPVPLLSFVNSADAGAAITGIRQNAAFRTNVGFAAGADGATYSLTLATAEGATVATTAASLGAFGWTQPGIQDLFPTTTIPDNATLRVKVTAGSVDVFDSSIDNLSGDPVVTPIAPLPVAIPSSATIGPQGGSIRSDDGRLTLRVPAGALSSSASLSFTTNASNDVPQGIGAKYTLSPGGLAFVKPATLVFSYGTDDTDGSAPAWLGLACRSGSTWYSVSGGSVSTAARTLTVPIGSTTPAATVVSETRRAPDASSPEDWGPFQGLQILPRSTETATGYGKVKLSLWVPGPPPWAGALALVRLATSAQAADLDTAWYVNGDFLGDGSEGSVTDEGGGIAEYSAPRCLPLINPALVAVKVYYTSARTGARLSQTLAAKVYVAPRNWTLTFIVSSEAHCKGTPGQLETQIADKITWTQEADVILDDYATFSKILTKSQSLSEGPPTLCVKPGCGPVTDIKLKGIITPYAQGEGAYLPSLNLFSITLNIGTNGPDGGYDVFSCGDPMPDPFDLPVCRMSFDGLVLISAEAPNFTGEMTIDPKLIDRSSGGGDRVDASIVVKLEAKGCP